jgi:UDP-glucose 4-epimerase
MASTNERLNYCAAALRIFSAFGAGLKRQALWDFASRCARDGALQIDGDGSESRDFIHADDIALAVLTVLEKAPMHGEVYNTANGREISIFELAKTIAHRFDSRIEVRLSGSRPPGTPTRWRADVSRLSALGFAPSTEFWPAVDAFVEWFKAHG